MEPWLEKAYERIEKMPEDAKDIRERAREDLYFFACLMNPGYMYGDIHRKLFRWMQDYHLFGQGESSSSNKLIMLARAHLKSHMVAVWAAWLITRHPEVTILYISATAELAEIQLYAIKNILGSSRYQRYFPEYINPQEGNRERWSVTKITIDHPKRKLEGIRDATIATAGLTTNTTGWHADVICADDLVVPENAYTAEGRENVRKKTSQFTSIRNAGGFTMACGTRYHPSDIYDTWRKQSYEVYNAEMEVIDKRPIWEIEEHPVEVDGVFSWPRVVRPSDNKAFGFDPNTLSRIKGEYEDRVQFLAQYYLDPNSGSTARVSRDKFQYYNPRHVKRQGRTWFYKERRLNVYAAVDFAFSLKRKADFTAIVVIGIDYDGNIYILDMDRFKSDRVAEYYSHIKALHDRWDFRKIRAEVTVAQQIIVNDLKDMIKDEGRSLSVDEYRPSRVEGSKEERMAATLEPRYEDLKIWHFEGGHTPALEEEVTQLHPANDDLKDSLTSAIAIAVKPKQPRAPKGGEFEDMFSLPTHSKFGGIAFR